MKEFFATSTNEAITGTVSHADKLKGWFVMVRETAGDRTRQPVWGGRRVGMVVVRRRQAAQGYVDGDHYDCMSAMWPPRPPVESTSTDIPSCVTRRPHAQCSALAQSRAGTNRESDKLVRQAGRLKGFL
jgi:hypothetical protein